MAESRTSSADREPVAVTTDPSRMDLDRVYRWLSEESGWARGMSREVFDRAVAGSLSFAALAREDTVGYARVVTDRATFAYLTDVFVAEDWRGRRIGRMLMAAILAHPDLQGLRRTVLVTHDAQRFYASFGFAEPAPPDYFMNRFGKV